MGVWADLNMRNKLDGNWGIGYGVILGFGGQVCLFW
jgi:hypothetical protein